MTSRIDHLHNLMLIRSNLDQAINLLEEELMKPEIPPLAHGQVWKHEWGDHYIVSELPYGFRLTSLVSGSPWSGDSGFNGSDKSFSYVGMALECVSVVEK